MEPEYYYHDILRWGFGFENPNMAAVIFACLLPLLWAGWLLAWKIKSPWLRIPAALLGAGIVFSNAFCLFKTYSRGGAVGAFAALAYLLLDLAWPHRPWRWAQIRSSSRGRAQVLVVVGMILMFIGVGLASRSWEVAEPESDASVSHRLIIWESALKMAVENPRGFGSGHSGDAYMQWYQPLEMTATYRTMVNSYLTFLVEQGWPLFALIIFAFSFFWFWVCRGGAGTTGFALSMSLRASILAFLVSGIFSTTMEEATIWIIPSLCALILIIWTALERKPVSRTIFLRGGLTAAGMCLVLFAAGWMLEDSDNLCRKFTFEKDGVTIAELQAKDRAKSDLTVTADDKVLGQPSGKLLRRLCLGTGNKLRFDRSSSNARQPALVLVGDSVGDGTDKAARLVLLAPATIPEDHASKLLENNPNAVLFLPEIDEDGRCSFWQGIADKSSSHPKVIQLPGVGLQVDWDWDQVIAAIRDL